ncbi:MAG: zinc transporter ZntB, partial [Gammaproteobacteria bacterium]|nr:zinc transporter ZntB [Gammaproteobacteria bacterium]
MDEQLPPLTESKDGLIVAYLLDGTGRGQALSWAEIKNWQPEQGLLWVNLDFSNPAAHDWVKSHSGLDPVVTAQLLAEHSSARCALTASGVLLNLRAFNVNPYSELEDSVSIRLWTDSHRIISLQRYHLSAIDAIIESIQQGLGPRTAGGFMSDLAAEILEKSNTLITALEE